MVNQRTRSHKIKERTKSAYAVEVSTEPGNSTNLNLFAEQVKALYRLLNQTTSTNPLSFPTPKPIASIATHGIPHYSLISQKLPKHVWIVDTEASDHISSLANSMMDYTPCNTTIDISMVDGTISLALGFGAVCLSKLKLKYVLHVPGLQCNLLSVSKLTRDMNYSVTFFSSYCIF